jgi:hypothetical protein
MPTKSMVALTSRAFKLAGELMVMSILQGGPAPNFLNPVVYSYLSREPLCPENNTQPLMKETAIRVSC